MAFKTPNCGQTAASVFLSSFYCHKTKSNGSQQTSDVHRCSQQTSDSPQDPKKWLGSQTKKNSLLKC